MIVLTRPAQTDSRLVRKLPHAQHRNGAKITRKSLPDGDREWTGLDIVRAKITRDIFGSDYIGPSVDAAYESMGCSLHLSVLLLNNNNNNYYY